MSQERTIRLILPTAAAAGVMWLMAFVLSIGDAAHQQQHHANKRLGVLYELSSARAHLERELNSRLFLASGLITYVSLNPALGEDEFRVFAAELMSEAPEFYAVQLAPRNGAKLAYPPADQRMHTDYDLFAHPEWADAARRATERGESVVGGPETLPDGTRVIVSQTPVYAAASELGRENGDLWGVVNLLIDLDALLRVSGVREETDGLLYAIRCGGLGSGGAGVFFGADKVFERDPVVNRIHFWSGSWQIAAVPEAGWGGSAPGTWELRLTSVSIVLLTGMLIWFLVWGRFALRKEINDRRRMENALRESERKLYTLMQNLPGMAYQCRPDENWTMDFVSRGCVELTGYQPNDLIGNRVISYGDIIHPEDRDEVHRSVMKSVEERCSFNEVYRIRTAHRKLKWMWEQGAGVRNEEGELVAIEGFILDITVRKQLEDELEKRSLQDGLTGISNRLFFDERFALEWSRAERSQTSLAIIMCDIDFFKLYNDTYGHPAGDKCLAIVAHELKATLRRATDFAARYGGEEFVVVLPETSEEGACFVAERLRQAVLEQCIPHQSSPVCDWVTVSLGVSACRPPPGTPSQRLVEAADHALYNAKRNGRNRAEKCAFAN